MMNLRTLHKKCVKKFTISFNQNIDVDLVQFPDS